MSDQTQKIREQRAIKRSSALDNGSTGTENYAVIHTVWSSSSRAGTATALEEVKGGRRHRQLLASGRRLSAARTSVVR